MQVADQPNLFSPTPRSGSDAYAFFKDRIFTPLRKQKEASMAERRSRQQGNDLLQLHILSILTEHHVGHDNAITNKRLRMRLNAVEGAPVKPVPSSWPADDYRRKRMFHLSMSDSRPVRNAVNEMRKKKVPVCSDSHRGYWWPENFRATVSTTDELTGRAKDIHHTVSCMIEGANEFFGRQAALEEAAPK